MKKIKWIMLALVLCLGLVGGAFAAWTDQVVMGGSIATAPELDVRFTSPNGYEIDTDYWTGRIDVREGGKLLRVLVYNAHPGTDYTFNYALFNHSTLPVMYKGFSDDSTIPANGFFEVELAEGTVVQPNSALTDTASFWIDTDANPGETYIIDIELDWELGTAWYQGQQ